MVAFAVSVALLVGGIGLCIAVGRRRPPGAPFTWGEALVAATFVFGLMLLGYGIVPNQWLKWADNELLWRSDKILTKVVVLAGVAGAAAALIAFLIALALGMSGTSIAIITVVAAVAGSVLGAAGGGALGSMTEAQKEEGVVLWVRSDRRATAEDAERTLRAHAPLRVDGFDGQGRPIRIG